MDWRTVHEKLRGLAKRRAELDAEEAHWLREAKRLRVWRELGYGSLLDYLEHLCGYTPRTARERVRVAEALEQLPQLARALVSGEINYSVARELTRVVVPDTESAWLQASRGRNVREVEELVSGHEPGDLPDAPAKPHLQTRRVSFDVGGDTFALLREARLILEEEHGSHLDDDALITMLCKRAIEPPAPDRAAHQIAVTICKSCRRGFQDGAGSIIEIGEAAVERAECDAEHIGSIDGHGPDQRAKQDVTPIVRRFVWRRDHGRCRVPGCRAARGLDIHHIVPRERGGDHEPENLLVMCSAHHMAVHEGLWVVQGPASRCVFERRALGPLPPQADVPDIVPFAVRALAKLGFRRGEATALVEQARTHVGPTTLSELIRHALRLAPSPTVP